MSALLGVVGAGAQAGSMLGVQKGGLDPFVFSDKPVEGAITTADMIDQPDGSTARWMFEEAARAHGLDPDAVVKGSPEHQRIAQDLGAALRALDDAPPPRGEAAQTEALRGAVRDAVIAGGPSLSMVQAGRLATMPGAQTFSSAEAQATLRGAASVARHPAAQAGLAVGVAGTIAAGGILGREGAKPQEETRATPFAKLDRAGEREEDDRCAPKGTDGTWIVIARPRMSDAAADYQRQISGTPELPGGLIIEYRVTRRSDGKSVDFDGCAFDRPGQPLLDAKYGYGELFSKHEAGQRWVEAGPLQQMRNEADSQSDVTARSHPVEWHASDSEVAPKLNEQQRLGSVYAPNMSVVHTPAIRVAN